MYKIRFNLLDFRNGSARQVVSWTKGVGDGSSLWTNLFNFIPIDRWKVGTSPARLKEFKILRSTFDIRQAALFSEHQKLNASEQASGKTMSGVWQEA